MARSKAFYILSAVIFLSSVCNVSGSSSSSSSSSSESSDDLMPASMPPPLVVPTMSPTMPPTMPPTGMPTVSPTTPMPTMSPTDAALIVPTVSPTASPVPPLVVPTMSPTGNPTASPSANPTAPPSANPTVSPSANPTAPPTAPTITTTLATLFVSGQAMITAPFSAIGATDAERRAFALNALRMVIPNNVTIAIESVTDGGSGSVIIYTLSDTSQAVIDAALAGINTAVITMAPQTQNGVNYIFGTNQVMALPTSSPTLPPTGATPGPTLNPTAATPGPTLNPTVSPTLSPTLPALFTSGTAVINADFTTLMPNATAFALRALEMAIDEDVGIMILDVFQQDGTTNTVIVYTLTDTSQLVLDMAVADINLAVTNMTPFTQGPPTGTYMFITNGIMAVPTTSPTPAPTGVTPGPTLNPTAATPGPTLNPTGNPTVSPTLPTLFVSGTAVTNADFTSLTNTTAFGLMALRMAIDEDVDITVLDVFQQEGSTNAVIVYLLADTDQTELDAAIGDINAAVVNMTPFSQTDPGQYMFLTNGVMATPTTSPTPSPTTPTNGPTVSPTAPTASPSTSPSVSPSASPSTSPSASPSASPSTSPSASPSTSPSMSPSASPSTSPSMSPSASPSTSPSTSPSSSPSVSPSVSPSTSPSVAPSRSPSTSPSMSPSTSPSMSPSRSPTASPTITTTPSPVTP